MTARARFTQAEIARAIRAAAACGRVALMTPAGIVFVESEKVQLPSPPQSAGGNTCDAAFGVAGEPS